MKALYVRWTSLSMIWKRQQNHIVINYSSIWESVCFCLTLTLCSAKRQRKKRLRIGIPIRRREGVRGYAQVNYVCIFIHLSCVNPETDAEKVRFEPLFSSARIKQLPKLCLKGHWNKQISPTCLVLPSNFDRLKCLYNKLEAYPEKIYIVLMRYNYWFF